MEDYTKAEKKRKKIETRSAAPTKRVRRSLQDQAPKMQGWLCESGEDPASTGIRQGSFDKVNNMTGERSVSPRGSPKAGAGWKADFGKGMSEVEETGLANLTSGHRIEEKIAGHEDKNRAARCLDSILTVSGQFVGRNATRYLELYESKMRVNLVDERLALDSFITLVGKSLQPLVADLIDRSNGDWDVFGNKLKREFFAEDADRVTRTSFMAWVQDRTKTLGPMELMREFELKLGSLPARDKRSIEITKVEIFLDAAGPRMRKELNCALDLFSPGRDDEDTEWEDLLKAVRQVEACRRRADKEDDDKREVQTLMGEIRRLQGIVSDSPKQGSVSYPSPTPVVLAPVTNPGSHSNSPFVPVVPAFQPEAKQSGQSNTDTNRIYRCMWCDSLDHAWKECEDFKKYTQDNIVKYIDKKLAFSDSGESIPTNFGKGGMKEIVDRKVKGKTIATSSYSFEPSVLVQAVGVNEVTRKSFECTDKTTSDTTGLDEDGQLALAEYLQGESGWDCPVFISTATAASWGSWSDSQAQAYATGEGTSKANQTKELPAAEGERPPVEKTEIKKNDKGSKKEKGKNKPFFLGRGVDLQFDKDRISNLFWSQEMRGLSISDFFGSIRKDVQEEIMEKLKRRKMIKGEGGATVGLVFASDDQQAEVEEWGDNVAKEDREVSKPTYQAYVNAVRRWTPNSEATVGSLRGLSNPEIDPKEMCWARGCSMCEIELKSVTGAVPALLDSGSEVNLMSLAVYKKGGWPVDRNCGWEVNSVNESSLGLWGACARVLTRIGNLVEPINIFVHASLPQSVILGQPFITELRMETKVLDDGSQVAKIKSRDNLQEVQFPTVRAGNVRNRAQLRTEPVVTKNEGF